MPKTRLRNSDRNAIRSKIIAHKFDSVRQALRQEEYGLAAEARTLLYGDFLAVMDAAPEGAFPNSWSLRLNVGGRSITVSFGESGRDDGPRIFYEHDRGYGERPVVVASSPLGERIVSNATRQEQLKADRAKLSNVTDGALSKFNNFEDLLEGWPEASVFVREVWAHRPDYKPALPAVLLGDLSAQLDLPPEVAEVAAVA